MTISFEGYHPRIDGAYFVLTQDVKSCDRCNRAFNCLFGIEKDYPNNPDMYVCAECFKELFGEPE